MKTLAEYEELAAQAHGHLCAGQILGIRMSLHGLSLLDIQDPEGADRKRLMTYVEIDRCATDAIALVTGCRLGKRALKFKDFGKMAATFCDLKTGLSVRLAARENSRDKAAALYPEISDKRQAQIRAYRELSDAVLFQMEWVKVVIPAEEMPGYKSGRVTCSLCGESINFQRELILDGQPLCRACGGERYYQPMAPQ